MQILKSKIDNSVNYIYPLNNGLIESRFVQRQQDYIAIYLSSHNGCNKSCRFCHLTQTKQTMNDEASMADYMGQAQLAFTEYDNKTFNNKKSIKKVHYNFMSRGEPLSNSIFSNQILIKELFNNLNNLCLGRRLENRFNISTIIPSNIKLYNINFINGTNLYYSLYSLNKDFRKKWIPKAQDPESNEVKAALKNWSNNSSIRFHWAYIRGENDSIEDTKRVAEYIYNLRLNCEKKISIIQYNPPYEGHSEESHTDIIQKNIEILNKVAKIKMIQRVGFDVKASCGMFVS